MRPIPDHDGLSPLSGGESEQLLLAIQASLAIRRRYQFHIWVQSRLAAIVSHDILICGHHDPARRALAFDCFSMFPLAREGMARLTDPGEGLVTSVVAAWNRCERTPCGSEAGFDPAGSASLDAVMRSAGVRDFVAHGMSSARESGGIESFFCFANALDSIVPAQIKRDSTPLSPRHGFLVELLLPYLHATYARVVAAERPAGGARDDAPVPERLITEREVEILLWVREGKSNHQIGSELGISPLTVKNHIQKILRKLGAANRAQAVSKAITFGLLQDAAAP